MHIDPWTLALQTINVLILVGLLSRFLYRPVLKVIADRQAAADKLLADAAMAKEDAEAQASALQSQNAALAADSERLHAEARAAAEAERQRLLEQAGAEAAALASQTEAAGAAKRARVAHELEGKAGELAGHMAEKLLGRIDPRDAIPGLFRALLARLHDLQPAERARLAEDGPLAVVTATILSADEQARYAAALAEILPGIGTPAFTVDPTLIAGFELRGPHAQVRNSWRADLDALTAGVAREDDRGG